MKIRTTNSICTLQDFADVPMSPTTGKVTHTHCVNVKTILVSLYNIPEIEKHLFHVNAEPCKTTNLQCWANWRVCISVAAPVL